MTIATKGMGAIIKKLTNEGKKLLKKSKKFPGPKATDQLNKRVAKRGRGIGPGDIETYGRINRTQQLRDRTATKLRSFRKNKGRLVKEEVMGFGKKDKKVFHPKRKSDRKKFIKDLKRGLE